MLNLAGAAVSAASTLGVTIFVTRGFTKPVAGAFFAATSLYLVVEAAANLGAYNGIIYFTARLRSVGADAKVPRMLRSAVIPVLVASTIAAVALAALARPLASELVGSGLRNGVRPGTVATMLRILAVTLPFAALADTFLGATRGFRDMRPTVLVDRIGRSGLQLVAVGLVVLAGGSAFLGPAWALPYIPAAVLGYLCLRTIQRRKSTGSAARAAAAPSDVQPGQAGPLPRAGARAELQLSAASWSAFWRFTAPRSLASIAQIIIQRLDIVLVGVMRGPVDAAVYAAATRFLVVGQLGNAAISMAAQPQFTHLFAVGDRRAANVVYQATTAWLILLTWPLYLLAIFYGSQVLAVFGHSYQAGSFVMVILGLAMLIATGCGQVDVVLTTAGRTSWSLANGLLAVAVNVGTDLALIPRLGITGAAIGWAAAIVVSNLVPLAQVAAAIRVHPFGRATFAACALTAVSFAAIPAAARAVSGPGLAVSCLAIVLGLAVMVAGLVAFRSAFQLGLLPRMPARRSLAGPARQPRGRPGRHRAS